MLLKIEELRYRIDKALSLFHFKKAERLAKQGLVLSQKEKIKHFEYYFKAQLFIINEDYQRAVYYLNLALRENPQDSFSLNDKGICLAELGKVGEALPYFDKAIKFFPEYPTFYQNKGWALTLKGEFQKALPYFYKALEFEPEKGESIFSIGFCLEKLAEYKKAKDYYFKALRLMKGKSRFAQFKIKEALRRL
ncbi:MAG TPA: tetratricopeptide repeat protein [Candidatus Omnitrophica bacterium]|nr:MAG: hypothetical protein DRP69_03620 [Candidatus Omnitrophota bacterium]RKY42613.1 MAG: hypothetical protein DRP80_06615 [Candidatus Omnitrophota bacterium]HEC70065.1 tetratricopeptide repeat protein [Candidatus Omnitrophota bacterium]